MTTRHFLLSAWMMIQAGAAALAQTVEGDTLQTVLPPDTLTAPVLLTDSVAVADTPADTSSTATDNISFNALDYSMQKRYRKKRFTFPKGGFTSNLYVSPYLSAENYLRRPESHMGINYMAGIAVGKAFSAAHSVRLAFDYGIANHNLLPERFTRIGVNASYLFNATAYLLGYNPYRMFEESLVVGLGYTSTKGPESSYGVLNLHAGLQVKFHAWRQFDLMVEPIVRLYSDGIDHENQRNWHKYDFGYGASLGFIYRFSPLFVSAEHHLRPEEKSYERNLFVSLAAGGQLQLSEAARAAGLLSGMRPHGQLSVGKWTRPYLALRASVFYGTNVWKRLQTETGTPEPDPGTPEETPEETPEGEPEEAPAAPATPQAKNLTATYIGGRLELMFNPLGYMDRPWTERIKAALLFGVELGIMTKKDGQMGKRLYAGLTGGLHVEMRFGQHWAAFVEPRYSWVPYTYLHKKADDTYLPRITYTDHICSISVGSAYYF